MADIQSRQGSAGSYRGLGNQAILTVCIGVTCLLTYETIRRKRRPGIQQFPDTERDGLGRIETWKYGYLYNGRSWAKNPSPPADRRPLGWAWQALKITEEELLHLAGLDKAIYTRFLRTCFYFTVVHVCTSLPILLPIHYLLSPSSIATQSITRASLSSLISPDNTRGIKLLWVHLILIYWVTCTWLVGLLWFLHGVFRHRVTALHSVVDQVEAEAFARSDLPNQTTRDLEDEESMRGWRLRTVMMLNIPPQLRSDQALRDYFEFYLSRTLYKPSALEPGWASGMISFVYNRARALGKKRGAARQREKPQAQQDEEKAARETARRGSDGLVAKVVLVRKMGELAALHQRRDEILQKLEMAHIRLAQHVKTAVIKHVRARDEALKDIKKEGVKDKKGDLEKGKEKEHAGEWTEEPPIENPDHLDMIERIIGPFIDRDPHVSILDRVVAVWEKCRDKVLRRPPSTITLPPSATPSTSASTHPSIWSALHSLPRYYLTPYQPLVRVTSLFSGKKETLPTIDYLTGKLNWLSARIEEERAKTPETFNPSSSAFVTFRTAEDARRAWTLLPTHPKNPLLCETSPAPDVEDIDFVRLMKSNLTGEYVKSWVIGAIVWGFTLFWVIPVSIFVGLFSLDNIKAYVPAVASYLNRHPKQAELVSSLVPTVIFSLLILLIPLLLLLIARKAQNFVTFSSLHNIILMRYHKFLVANLLIFFCVGAAALRSFLASFRGTGKIDPIHLIAQSFPTAAPFYVGWMIFQTAMHNLVQVALIGVPLLQYLAAAISMSVHKGQTPRSRLKMTRPRTFDIFYWLPNHLVVLIINIVFIILNPLVIPFAMIYFFVSLTVFKNQFLHVYSKKYEGKGVVIAIRFLRYSLDGCVIAQLVYLALAVLTKKNAYAGVTGALVGLTIIAKLVITRIVKAKFKELDIAEATILCDRGVSVAVSRLDGSDTFDNRPPSTNRTAPNHGSAQPSATDHNQTQTNRFWSWSAFAGVNIGYSTLPIKLRITQPRPRIPFAPSPKEVPDASGDDTEHKISSEDQHADIKPQIVITPSGEDSTPRIPQQELEQPHPKRQPWDDSDAPRLSRSYDNPFYTREIHPSLWLPRNTGCPVDLDDTVDVFQSLTSDPDSTKIGKWHHETETSHLLSMASSFGMEGTPSIRKLHLENLPSPIPKKILPDNGEDFVESPQEETDFSQPMSPASTQYLDPKNSLARRSSTMPRRPTIARRASSQRMWSGSSGRGSMLGVEVEDVPALAVMGRARSSTLMSRTSAVTGFSARSAIYSGVLAEEAHASAERLRGEQEDEITPPPPRSTLRTWLYRHAHHEDPNVIIPT